MAEPTYIVIDADAFNPSSWADPNLPMSLDLFADKVTRVEGNFHTHQVISLWLLRTLDEGALGKEYAKDFVEAFMEHGFFARVLKEVEEFDPFLADVTVDDLFREPGPMREATDEEMESLERCLVCEVLGRAMGMEPE